MDINLPAGLNFGDHVRVKWKDPKVGGLTNCTLTLFPPMYGLHWIHGEWYVYNGKVRGKRIKSSLTSFDKDAIVVKNYKGEANGIS